MKRTIQEIERFEEDRCYFRLTRFDDDLTGNSVETANVSRKEAAELFNIDIGDLDEALEEKELYYDDEKTGIYWNGVCCTDTIEGMIEYFGLSSKSGIIGIEDAELVVFRGNWIESCGDGDVVEMTEIIERISVAEIRW